MTGTTHQFVRFATIGAVAFFVDTAVLYAALGLGANPYLGRVASFLAAATLTWVLNRRYTFVATDGAPLVQWAKFLGANAVGGFVNYSVYAALIAFVPIVRAHPVLGVAAGSLCGLVLNFSVSRQWVFGGSRSGERSHNSDRSLWEQSPDREPRNRG